jgi:23S rRNA (adenine2503-C2)-methyltransferase
MLEILAQTAENNIAKVYLAKTTRNNQHIEFVESLQPPFPIEEKWVLIVSTLFGCVVGCPMCDAGGWYQGKLTKDEMLAQIDYLIIQRFPNKNVNVKKFKIQFARMGEPTLNDAVLHVLEELPKLYNAPGLMPSISTVAPKSCNAFFDQLLKIKNQHYPNGNFQLQFSIHTTDQNLRELIIPIKKWDFATIAAFGTRFKYPSDRKITLNFALAKNYSIDPKVLQNYFDPEKFLIKITPINPTINAENNNIKSYFTNGAETKDQAKLIKKIQEAGYEVLLSIGELEENKIGSNCGQYIRKFLGQNKKTRTNKMYTYSLKQKDT